MYANVIKVIKLRAPRIRRDALSSSGLTGSNARSECVRAWSIGAMFARNRFFIEINHQNALSKRRLLSDLMTADASQAPEAEDKKKRTNERIE